MTNPGAQKWEKSVISISGLIGAGKSTLTKALAEVLGFKAYYEKVSDNEYLEAFYNDMKSNSFSFQVYLLNNRFELRQKVIWNQEGSVMDRSIYEDRIFAKILWKMGNMSDRDYRNYLNLFNNMMNFTRKDTIIIHLDVTPQEALERIKLRGRECEKGITLEYLQILHEGYEEFLSDIDQSIPVIRVKYDKFHKVEDIANEIKKAYENIHTTSKIYY